MVTLWVTIKGFAVKIEDFKACKRFALDCPPSGDHGFPFVSQRETIRNNQGLCPCMLLKSLIELLLQDFFGCKIFYLLKETQCEAFLTKLYPFGCAQNSSCFSWYFRRFYQASTTPCKENQVRKTKSSISGILNSGILKRAYLKMLRTTFLLEDFKSEEEGSFCSMLLKPLQDFNKQKYAYKAC